MTAPDGVELIEDAQRLSEIEIAWDALWRRRPEATVFSSPAWCLPWWSAFSPGRLATLAVWSNGALGALAPLYLEDGPYGRRLLPLGIGLSDYLDVLVDEDVGPGLGATVASGIASVPDWESCELGELPPGAAGFSLPLPPDCRDERTEASACPTLKLSISGPDPLAAVPALQRRKIRMARHRTARRAGEVRVVAGPEETGPFLADLVRLHGARWAERGEGGVLADERVRRFHAAALPALAEAGLLRAATLAVGDQTVAAYYGLSDGGRAYAYLAGFDPAFAFESPGTVLLAHAVERAREEGAGEFHFLRGREPYKYAWGAEDRVNVRRTFRRNQR